MYSNSHLLPCCKCLAHLCCIDGDSPEMVVAVPLIVVQLLQLHPR